LKILYAPLGIACDILANVKTVAVFASDDPVADQARVVTPV